MHNPFSTLKLYSYDLTFVLLGWVFLLFEEHHPNPLFAANSQYETWKHSLKDEIANSFYNFTSRAQNSYLKLRMFDFAEEFSSHKQCEAVNAENQNDCEDDDFSDGRKCPSDTGPNLLEGCCLLLFVVHVKDWFTLETLYSSFVTWILNARLLLPGRFWCAGNETGSGSRCCGDKSSCCNHCPWALWI